MFIRSDGPVCICIYSSLGGKWTALTSSICLATFGSVEYDFIGGSFQLFTSYHHLRILLPSVRPLSEAFRFQNRHPESARVHSVPWTSGKITCARVSDLFFYSMAWSNSGESYLIPGRNPRNPSPRIRILQTRQITLLKTQVRQRWEVPLSHNRPHHSTRVDYIGGDAVCV